MCLTLNIFYILIKEMFSSYSGENVNIQPIIPKRRQVTESGIQTEIISTESQITQVPETKSSQIQTDNEKRKASCVEFDPEALVQFLNRVAPMVCSYLEKNLRSHAFDHYQLLSDTDNSSTYITHSLTCKLSEIEFFCSDASWNSTGTAIAVAYSKSTHQDWCEHDANVAVWNLNRKNFSPEKPNTLIDTECCVTCVAFHPNMPAILAAGKFNGEIILWNIAKEDDMVMGQSETTVDAHRDAITGLHWSTEDKQKLISCSLDGKILIWRYEERKQELQLVDGFIILANQLSRVLRIKSVRPGAEVGVSCMSINSEDPSIFVIGTDGGGIFQCSFNSRMPVPAMRNSSFILKFPITVNFQKMNGHVCSIDFSPFSRNIFLAAGSDGDLRIYSLLQPKPILKIRLPGIIQKAQWSLVRPLVIAAVLSDGNLYMFDITNQQLQPAEVLPLFTEKIEGKTIAFNAEDPQLLATGASNGSCQIWILGSQLISVKSYEMEQLNTLIRSEEDIHETQSSVS